MIFKPTRLEGVIVIELEPRGDARGFFSRVFCADEMESAGIPRGIAQVNNSASAERGTLRGLHYQLPPHAESKTVRCLRGSVFDVAVDVREGSPTFGQWFGVELTAANRNMLHIPKGCAHGFLTLEPNSEVLYFVDTPYHAKSERGLRWNDPAFGARWPDQPTVISDRDANHPLFDDAAAHFETGVLDLLAPTSKRESIGDARR